MSSLCCRLSRPQLHSITLDSFTLRVRPFKSVRHQSFRSRLHSHSHPHSRPRPSRRLYALGLAPILCDFPSLDTVNSHPHFQTREQYLLAKSDESNQRQHSSPFKHVLAFFDYVYDTLATCFRFLHLASIFTPVILMSPAVLVGKRVAESETTGALWWYKYLIWSMEQAGPTFIKLGQWAASRTDIFPRMMCAEMSKLHSSVKPHSLSYTKSEINKAFNTKTLADVFSEFDATPLGIGAIAQVYKAKLAPQMLRSVPDSDRRSDVWVAVKVLHPHVEQKVRRDLQIMNFFASLINIVPTLEWLSLPDEVAQFGNMMRLQMDLRIESANLSIFAHNFSHRERIHFPISYSALLPGTDSPRVLVEEFVPAIPMGKLLALPSDGRVEMEEEIADMGLNAFLNMLLIDNFIHADLHPGNIMVRFVRPTKRGPSSVWTKNEHFDAHQTDTITSSLAHITDPTQFRAKLTALDRDGFRPQIVFLDAGLVTELNETDRRNFLDLFASLATFDGYRAGELMVERSRTPATVLDPDVFALKMQHLLLGVKSRTFALGNFRISEVLNTVLSMVRTHHVRMEGDFVNVVLSVLLLEGIGRQLDPNLDIFRSSLPILRKLGAMSGPDAIKHQSVTPMLKVWLALEARQFVSGSAAGINRLVRYDLLCPNV
ncbi:ABC1 family-domain-containing protein [Lipomyces arxii]|uniref:ABC1 family-domain-containing protein n=1 Tax=Lipomyces arxii TaxID=56418 RepID=UPI0034CEF3D1